MGHLACELVQETEDLARLTDKLLELIQLADESGRHFTSSLLKMALLNEVQTMTAVGAGGDRWNYAADEAKRRLS